jgi:asparagine synthase (glutamine-hydrolysing)
LETLGHQFYTRSDTETIVHAYEEFGDECLQHLNGMFAIALWDERRRRLLLARDRAGIKPLLYTQLGTQLVFASELKAILTHPGVERRIDLVALDQYLTFEYVPTPRTIVRNVSRLPPGHYLIFSEKGVSIHQYWDLHLRRSESRAPVSAADFTRRLRHNLAEAVRCEMLSDVPIGVLLSGGIDSSAVAAFMAEVSPEQVNSFSIAFEDRSFDESAYARQVAQHLGTKHHELTVTAADLLAVVPRLAELVDEPLGDSSFIPTYLLSRFVREHVKVALGGDGGDELFAGYSTLQAHRLVEWYQRLLPWFVRAQIVPPVVDRLPVSFDNISLDFKMRRFIAGRGVPLEVRHHRWLGSFTVEEKSQLFLPWATLGEVDTYAPAFAHSRTCDAREEMNRLLYLDMKLYMEGDILTKVDRASMANSLEVRVPLLNATVVEFGSSIPHTLKLRGLTTKYILRRCLWGLLPKAILKRGKKGFNIPIAKWITNELRGLVLDLLSPARLQREGLFNPTYVEELLADHFARKRDNRKLLWTLLVFELWRERYGVTVASQPQFAPYVLAMHQEDVAR